MECECATESTTTTTCSFQNKTSTSCKPKASRKRGISAVLQDATNIGVSSNSIVDHRACKYKAVERWQDQIKPSKPRGDPAAGPPARNTKNKSTNMSTANTTSPTVTEKLEASSLYRVFHHHKALFDLGQTSISNFIEGNVSWEIRKAFAIQVLVTGMNVCLGSWYFRCLKISS